MGARKARRKTLGGSSPDSMGDTVEFGSLPENCISHILSFTTPRDTCRLAAVSRVFRSAGEPDAVWEGFLPADYRDVLAGADEPLEFRSKKELYFQLCRPLLLANGRVSFALEKPTGKKCYMLSARDCRIVHSDIPMNWSWGLHPKSRFPEVAALIQVYWLEMVAKINAAILSPKTTYAAYLVYQLSPHVSNLSFPHQKATITIGRCYYTHTLMLQPKGNGSVVSKWHNLRGPTIFNVPLRMAQVYRQPDYSELGATSEKREQVIINRDRNDGWREVVLGGFKLDERYDGDVKISVYQLSSIHLKRGLIVEGIEVRPID